MHGYTVAIRWAAGIMLLAGLVAGLTGTARAPGHGARTGGRVAEPAARTAGPRGLRPWPGDP